jgi:hypothetical protein
MNTQLIYVSKEKAEIQDDTTGNFTNQVSQGVKVALGSQVSVEGIAINSTGVGSDIIEIPQKLLNYEYETNEVQFNCWAYIHNNFEYTCRVPFLGAAVNVTSSANDYGYLDNTAIPSVFTTGASSVPFPLQTPGPDFAGERMYIGRYAIPEEAYDSNTYTIDRQNPPVLDVPDNLVEWNVPGGGEGFGSQGVSLSRVWCPLKTDMVGSVDFGYDNPTNIANKITADMHSADVAPFQQTQLVGSNNGVTNVNSYLEKDNVAADGIPPLPRPRQLICSTQNSSSLLIRGNPISTSAHNIPTAGPNPNLLCNSYYNSWLAVANPQYVYWGSRLLAQETIKANQFCNARPAMNNPVLQNTIVNLLSENIVTPGPPARSGWAKGSVLCTNIGYNERNVKTMRSFLIETKRFNETSGLANTEELDGKRKSGFETPIDIGRDEEIVNNTIRWSTGYTRLALQPNFKIATEVGVAPQNFTMKTFYNKEYINSAFLPDEANNFVGFKLQDNPVPYEGQQVNPSTIAQLLDINIVCVNTGISGAGELVIGLVRNGYSVEGSFTNPPTTATGGSADYSFNNYALVNLQFTNPRNRTCMVVNPYTIKNPASPAVAADFDGLVNVGAPNIKLIFDETRGRFALNQMSWPAFTEAILSSATPPTVLSVGGDEVITANKYRENFGAQGASSGGVVICKKSIFTEYAQSGLGIHNISVKNIKTNAYEEIDYYNQTDITNKFNGSLWNRLGFEYNKFINKNGIPTAIYTERHHNQSQRLPNVDLFPYPITNNAQFDTALSYSLDVGIGAVNAPKFSLSTERNQPNISITSESANTYATNLPQKLEYPYWLIQSDIIEGCRFNSENNGSEDNIVAMCNRAYLAGDFAFSFAPDYKFTATKDYVITGISTRILNPDLTPARINDKTSVIYKIETPIPMFTNTKTTPQDLEGEPKNAKEQHSPPGPK